MACTFSETQHFTQRWLWIMLIGMMLVLVGVFGYGMLEQLIFGRVWGNRPMSDGMLLLVGSAVMLFSIGMIYIFYTLKLITEVREAGLYIRFYPLWSKVIPYHSIQSCQARTYNPLREYGGWGIKYGNSGWVYNVIGDRGVQLILVNGRRILIGSQCADELERAIKVHCHSE